MRPPRRTLLTLFKSLSKSSQRMALAVAASLLLHSLMLLLPPIELPEFEAKLPPLTAKLEALPKPSTKVATKKEKPKTQPAPQPNPVVQATPEIPIMESAVAAASAPEAAEPEPEPAPPVEIAQETPAPPAEPQRPLLPKHARLKFNVYQGEGNFKVGESSHKLDIEDGYYTLKASVQTTGLVGILKNYRMVQTSGGEASAYVLKPDVFTEEVTDSSGKKTNRAEFDWSNNKVHFSNGKEASLPKHAQDILSIMYQFPPMSKQVEVITINIATGKKFEEYRFEIMFAETLKTPMGELQTVHFRKLHRANEE
ncbi:MAG: DUF3108 domain-containing protein, partial [Gallionellaceae bacterium]|nr:DUF3108 domain-containing protein [Gallionellaceae bacterium]